MALGKNSLAQLKKLNYHIFNVKQQPDSRYNL